MGILSEGLFKIGLVSEKEFNEREAEKALAEKQEEKDQVVKLESKKIKQDELKKCKTIKAFKHMVKQVLLENSSQIRRIIQTAHHFKKDEERKKLIWFLYQVRDGLENLSKEKHKEFLNKSFRKMGSIIVPK
ncbi:hypothetical protein KJ684_03005 [Patescibacteria group bacterium]|nr:hypothetical protein [Patescibacteria group bacterium]